jgi:hypothetical protein
LYNNYVKILIKGEIFMAKGNNKLVEVVLTILEIFWIGGLIVGIKRILEGKIIIGILNIFLGTIFGIIDLSVIITSGRMAFGTKF